MTKQIKNTRVADAYQQLAHAMFTADEVEVQYLDYRGMKNRSADTPACDDEIRDLLAGNRVVDQEDVLLMIGSKRLRDFIKSGFLKLQGDWYWVTKKAAERFGFRDYVVMDGYRVDLV